YTVYPPRCTPPDPSCVPELIVPGPSNVYRSSAKRYPLSEDASEGGSCEHDGDCYRECGDCTSRFRMQPSRRCLPLGVVRDNAVFCGCIERNCRNFAQQLRARIVTTLRDIEVQLAGVITSDPKLMDEASELFEVDLAHCYERERPLLPARDRFVVQVGKYGESDVTLTGEPTRARKCVRDALTELTRLPNWISEDFVKHRAVRFAGVLETRIQWVP
ncbi:MAG TPA: hypothetical protein VIM73_17670, partial [Polyangiaceae bacterium]